MDQFDNASKSGELDEVSRPDSGKPGSGDVFIDAFGKFFAEEECTLQEPEVLGEFPHDLSHLHRDEKGYQRVRRNSQIFWDPTLQQLSMPSESTCGVLNLRESTQPAISPSSASTERKNRAFWEAWALQQGPSRSIRGRSDSHQTFPSKAFIRESRTSSSVFDLSEVETEFDDTFGAQLDRQDNKENRDPTAELLIEERP